MTELIHVPGIGNSGEAHWQSLWERRDPTIRRFAPLDWDRPELEDWMAALESAVRAAPAPPILVAHSLGCLAVAIWQSRSWAPVSGAMLVSVPDPAAPVFPSEAKAFSIVPTRRFRFPSLIVASGDDPFTSLAVSQARARHWGSDFIEIGRKGHINASSGLGDWPEGLALLHGFCAGLHHGRTVP